MESKPKKQGNGSWPQKADFNAELRPTTCILNPEGPFPLPGLWRAVVSLCEESRRGASGKTAGSLRGRLEAFGEPSGALA